MKNNIKDNLYKVKNPKGYYDVYEGTRHIQLPEFKKRGLNIEHISEKAITPPATPIPKIKYETPPKAKDAVRDIQTNTPIENTQLSKGGQYVKVGKDVYNATTGEHIGLPEFKDLGLNYDLLPEATPEQQQAIGVSTQKEGLMSKITSLLKNQPTFDYQKNLSDMATSLGISNIKDKLTNQLVKTQNIQNQIDQLNAQRTIEIQNNNQRLTSMATINKANEATNRKYDQEIALLSMKKAGEAAIARIYQGDLTDAEQLLQQGIKAGLIDYEQKVHSFDTLLNVYSNWYSSLDATQRKIIQESYDEAVRKYQQAERDKQTVAKLMLTPEGAAAGVRLTDTPDEAIQKTSQYIATHPKLNLGAMENPMIADNPIVLQGWAVPYLNGQLSGASLIKGLTAVKRIIGDDPIGNIVLSSRDNILSKIQLAFSSPVSQKKIDVGAIKQQIFRKIAPDLKKQGMSDSQIIDKINSWWSYLIPQSYINQLAAEASKKSGLPVDVSSVIVDNFGEPAQPSFTPPSIEGNGIGEYGWTKVNTGIDEKKRREEINRKTEEFTNKMKEAQNVSNLFGGVKNKVSNWLKSFGL